MKRAVRSAGVAALVVGSSIFLLSGARASEIVLGESSDGGGTAMNVVSFTSLGTPGSVLVSITGGNPTGGAFFDIPGGPNGTYSLGSASFTAGPSTTGIFPVGSNFESFSFLA